MGGLRPDRRLRALLPDHGATRRADSPIEGSRDDGPAPWPSSRRRSRRSRPTTTTPPSSSTRPARPASPRAPSCGTATCVTTRSPSVDLFGADAERPDTYLCVLPLFHSFGQTVIQNGAFAFGGTVVMLPRFEAEAALAADAPRRTSRSSPACRRCTGACSVRSTTRRRRRRARAEPRGCRGRRGGAAGRDPPRSSRSGSASRSSRATGCRRRRRWRRSRRTARRSRVGSIGMPIPGVEMKLHRSPRLGRGRVVAGRDRRDRDQGPQHHEGLLRPARRHRRGDPATAGSGPATWPGRTRTASTTSSTGPRT